MIIFSDYIKVLTSVKKASLLFDTKFVHYNSKITNKNRIRITGIASVPNNVFNKIDFILGISDFIEDRKSIQQNFEIEFNNNNNYNISITPEVIRDYYGILKEDSVGSNSNNSITIASFGGFYSIEALEYFDKYFNEVGARVENVGYDCVITGECDQIEGNIDIQYSTAIGSNISSLFLSLDDNEWMLDWTMAIQLYDPIPNVASISFGWSEIQQCELEGTQCETMGINSIEYVERTNTEFQKLGIRGMSVLVSSGDCGAPGYYLSSGNCPIDSSENGYCKLGGCNHKSSECSAFTIQLLSNDTQCFIPMGQASEACGTITTNQTFVDSMNQFVLLNNEKCNTAFEYDIKNNQFLYSTCSCDQLDPVSNDEFNFIIIGYQFDQFNGGAFLPDFPASSPYITSIGGTQIKIQDDKDSSSSFLSSVNEVTCSIVTGSTITSGGGFSLIQPRKSYQDNAVLKYISNNLDSLPPSFAYNSSNRVFPDISLVSHSYQIAYTNKHNECLIQSVDGTSCSSPTLAGMFALINDKLLNLGKPQLGFLNPLLYQAAEEQPNVFNDIIEGNNNCNGAYCCQFGYFAVDGFDAATGLGSIQFNNLLSYILNKI